MTFRAWSERELYLLKSLFPCWPDRKVRLALEELGYPRKIKILRQQAKILKLNFEELSRPSGDFTKREKEVISKYNNLLFRQEENYDEIEESENVLIYPDGEVVVVCLTDLHWGAVEKDSNTGNIVFNTSICEEMLEQIPEKIINSIPNRDYAGIVFALGGDLVDGEGIYPTHGTHIEQAVIDQTTGLVKTLWKVFRKCLNLFGKVRIVAVSGNHGRSGRTNDERSNWDNVVYNQLKTIIEMYDDKNVSIEIGHGEYYDFSINGWRGHIRHIGVQHDGTAAMRQKLGSWQQLHKWDFIIFGHYHNVGRLGYNGMPVYRNGTLKVGDDYAEKLGRGDPAQQIVFGISKDRIETFFTLLRW
jgi:predicted phosphodiesterase